MPHRSHGFSGKQKDCAVGNIIELVPGMKEIRKELAALREFQAVLLQEGAGTQADMLGAIIVRLEEAVGELMKGRR